MARWWLLGACVLVFAALGYREAGRAPDAKALGGVCESTYECRKGTYCVQSGEVLQGQCSSDCNATSVCSGAFGLSSLCLASDLCAKTCRTTADCPAGTRCNGYAWCERQDVDW